MAGGGRGFEPGGNPFRYVTRTAVWGVTLIVLATIASFTYLIANGKNTDELMTFVNAGLNLAALAVSAVAAALAKTAAQKATSNNDMLSNGFMKRLVREAVDEQMQQRRVGEDTGALSVTEPDRWLPGGGSAQGGRSGT